MTFNKAFLHGSTSLLWMINSASVEAMQEQHLPYCDERTNNSLSSLTSHNLQCHPNDKEPKTTTLRRIDCRQDSIQFFLKITTAKRLCAALAPIFSQHRHNPKRLKHRQTKTYNNKRIGRECELRNHHWIRRHLLQTQRASSFDRLVFTVSVTKKRKNSSPHR